MKYYAAGDLCYLLLYNVFRVAALAPGFPHAIQSNSNLEMKFGDSSTSALANLVDHLPKDFTFKNGEIPLRCVIHKYFEYELPFNTWPFLNILIFLKKQK